MKGSIAFLLFCRFFKVLVFSVYEKIEGLSKMSKPRRSKSLSRTSSSRTSLGQTPILSQSSSLPFKTHTSSESTVSVATTLLASTHRPSHSRSSFDKTRAMKMFINNRSSTEQGGNNSLDGSQRLHMKSDSNLSDSTKSAATIIQGDDQLSRPDSPTLDVRARSLIWVYLAHDSIPGPGIRRYYALRFDHESITYT